METGSEDTFKEFLRIKRSVQSQYNTEGSFLAAHALAATKDGESRHIEEGPTAKDAMEMAERQVNKGPAFVRATTGGLKPSDNNGVPTESVNVEPAENEEEIHMSEEE